MFNIKVKEAVSPRDIEKIKSGDFTDRMFFMRHLEYGDWYMESVIPRDGMPEYPTPSPTVACISVRECVRVSLCDGNPTAMFLDVHIDRLNKKALVHRLPPVDRDNLKTAISTLVKSEIRFLSADNLLLAHILIQATEPTTPKKEVRGAVLTVSLEYMKREPTVPMRVMTDTCPVSVTERNIGSVSECAFSLARFYASEHGLDGILWLDNVYDKYILGISDMNFFYRTDDGAVTPENSFKGITFSAVTELMKSWDIRVTEKKISIDQFEKDCADGKIKEVFAVNTEKGILPVSCIEHNGKTLYFEEGKLAKKLSDAFSNMETGIYKPLNGMAETL